MARRFVYGHAGDGRGACYLERDESVPVSVCERYTHCSCSGPETMVMYEPVSEDLYMLVFATNLPEGSRVEKRAQIFVDGYAFTKEEITKKFKNPEELFEVQFCNSRDNYELGIMTSLAEMSGTSDKKQMTDLQKSAFLYSVLQNEKNNIESQLLQVIQPFEGAKWRKALIAALKVFPTEVRREISFCINPHKVTDMKYFEWNFVTNAVYKKFEETGYADGRLIERIVVTEHEIKDLDTKESREFYKWYKNHRGDIDTYMREMDGDRKAFREVMVKFHEDDKEPIPEQKTRRVRKERRKRTEKKAVAWGKLLAYLLLAAASGVWLVQQLRMDWKSNIQYLTINIDNDIFVFLAQFVFAFAVVFLVNGIRKNVREES